MRPGARRIGCLRATRRTSRSQLRRRAAPGRACPYGRWAERLEQELLACWAALDTDGADLGEPGEIAWYPDRSWHGRRYVPATSITTNGYELFGYVRFVSGLEATPRRREPMELTACGDFTEETAERNPDWKLDVCDEVIGSWHGQNGALAAMTLVWGRPLVGAGRVVTAELGRTTVDQCQLIEQRFTLIAPDDYLYDLLEIKLWGGKGQELACESLYDDAETDADADIEPGADAEPGAVDDYEIDDEEEQPTTGEDR